jgi:hypothetical protein
MSERTDQLRAAVIDELSRNYPIPANHILRNIDCSAGIALRHATAAIEELEATIADLERQLAEERHSVCGGCRMMSVGDACDCTLCKQSKKIKELEAEIAANHRKLEQASDTILEQSRQLAERKPRVLTDEEIVDIANEVWKQPLGWHQLVADFARKIIAQSCCVGQPPRVLTDNEIVDIAAKAYKLSAEWIHRGKAIQFARKIIAQSDWGTSDEQSKRIEELEAEVAKRGRELANCGIENYGVEALGGSFNRGHTLECQINTTSADLNCTCEGTLAGKILQAKTRIADLERQLAEPKANFIWRPDALRAELEKKVADLERQLEEEKATKPYMYARKLRETLSVRGNTIAKLERQLAERKPRVLADEEIMEIANEVWEQPLGWHQLVQDFARKIISQSGCVSQPPKVLSDEEINSKVASVLPFLTVDYSAKLREVVRDCIAQSGWGPSDEVTKSQQLLAEQVSAQTKLIAELEANREQQPKEPEPTPEEVIARGRDACRNVRDTNHVDAAAFQG